MERVLTGRDRYGIDRTPLAEYFYVEGITVFRNVTTMVHADSLVPHLNPTVKGWRALDPFINRQPNANHYAYIDNLLETPLLAADEPLRETLRGFVYHPDVVEFIQKIIGDDAYLHDCSLRISPTHMKRLGTWHRDSQSLTATCEEEDAMILRYANNPPYVVLELAITSSTETEFCLTSHARIDNEDEHDVRLANHGKNADVIRPYEAVKASLNAGDAVLYHPFILHRTRRFAECNQRVILCTWTTKSRMDAFGMPFPAIQ